MRQSNLQAESGGDRWRAVDSSHSSGLAREARDWRGGSEGAAEERWGRAGESLCLHSARVLGRGVKELTRDNRRGSRAFKQLLLTPFICQAKMTKQTTMDQNKRKLDVEPSRQRPELRKLIILG